FELNDVTVSEGESAVTVNLYRSGDFRQSTQLKFATEEITASEGKDYKGTGGTIIFQPGEGMKQITVPIIADDQAESDESFRLVLTEPSPNTLLMRDSIVITIKDTPPPISAPKLQIASVGAGKVTLSWEGEPGYALERTANAGSGKWEAVPCNPTVTG